MEVIHSRNRIIRYGLPLIIVLVISALIIISVLALKPQETTIAPGDVDLTTNAQIFNL